jgi:hypothetical protein
MPQTSATNHSEALGNPPLSHNVSGSTAPQAPIGADTPAKAAKTASPGPNPGF